MTTVYLHIDDEYFPINITEVAHIKEAMNGRKDFIAYCPHTLVKSEQGIVTVSLDGRMRQCTHDELYNALQKTIS